jgi:DNA-binding transcriptional LysR family regulator
MHPLIFSEFREFVGETFPAGTEATLGDLPGDDRSAGALAGAIRSVAAVVGTGEKDLTRRFGTYLFGRFAKLYPVMLANADSALSVLAELDGKVHAEVRRLHPDAEFPSFTSRRLGPDRLELTYRSSRPLAALAEGMIRGCIAHFGERLAVDCIEESADGRTAVFVLAPLPKRRAASSPRR